MIVIIFRFQAVVLWRLVLLEERWMAFSVLRVFFFISGPILYLFNPLAWHPHLWTVLLLVLPQYFTERNRITLLRLVVQLLLSGVWAAVLLSRGDNSSEEQFSVRNELCRQQAFPKLLIARFASLCWFLIYNAPPPPPPLFSRFLPDGKVFDASNAPGRKPIAFKLGARQVIKGWEEVLRLMNVRRSPCSLWFRFM